MTLLQLPPINTPNAPQVASVGGGAVEHSYAVVAITANGDSLPSAFTAAIGNAPGAGAAAWTITWKPSPLAVGYRVLKDDNAHFLASVNADVLSVQDTGQALTAYAAVAANPPPALPTGAPASNPGNVQRTDLGWGEDPNPTTPAPQGVQKVEQRFNYSEFEASTAGTTIKNGGGFLHGIAIVGGTLGAITLYDNTSAANPKIVGTFTPPAGFCGFITFDVVFVTGLTIVLAAATICTVSWR